MIGDNGIWEYGDRLCLPIRIGGLMRCCTETIREYAGAQDEGVVIPCKYCSDSVRVRAGAWEWNRELSL